MSSQKRNYYKFLGLFISILGVTPASASPDGGFDLGPVTQFGCTFINTLLGPFAVFYSLGIVGVGFAIMGFTRAGYGIIVKAFFVAAGLLFTAQIVDGLSGNRIQTLLASAAGCTIIGM
jgi:hypothetical protein